MSAGGQHGCWFAAAFLPHVVLFRLLSDIGSAIIHLVSRRAILETLIFEIPAAVKGTVGRLTRIG